MFVVLLEFLRARDPGLADFEEFLAYQVLHTCDEISSTDVNDDVKSVEK